MLRAVGIEPPPSGFLLHVGGAQWYKNRAGLLRLYAEHVANERAEGRTPRPLWMVGPPADAALQARIDALPADGRVVFHAALDNEVLAALYARADAFLFPSLAEGFGWPIAEALACGCPVLTTCEAPMTEVGGDAASYLPRMPLGGEAAWAQQGARSLAALLGETDDERRWRRQRGVEVTRRFESRAAIDACEAIYRRVHALEFATTPTDAIGVRA
jgi:glycosyltransferase involved in cell wall biosynthesis